MSRDSVGKALYGALFVVLLPASLVMWSRGAAPSISLPAYHSSLFGAACLGAGLCCIALGMLALWNIGRGLPMNAYPPTRYVSTGIYAIVPHPIYGGFAIVCIGASLFFGSASGLWLVTPVVVLASIGLLLGYELPDLRKRFGNEAVDGWILPPADDAVPTMTMRLRCYLTVLLPWVVLYEACVLKGIPGAAISTALPIDSSIPFLPWTEFVYATPYLVVAALPLIVRSNRSLREFSQLALLSFLLVFPVFLFVPLVTGVAIPEMHGGWAAIVKMERDLDSTACALPSYHVVWALIAAGVLAGKNRIARIAWYLWAFAVAISCLTTRTHTVLDLVAAFVAYLLLVNAHAVWRWMLAGSERLANSWREWRIGPVRIINHGAYAGAAAAVDIFLIDALLGPGHKVVSTAIFLGGAIGAALWAQWVEGSPALLRPLGFYGGMLGTVVAAFLGIAFGLSVWTVLAAICFAAPWLQAIGRLRCFVQGCCHGAPTEKNGIRYSHPRSRVCRIAGMRGVLVHPTQLYSIVGNGFVALILTRLLVLHVPSTMLCGVYLIATGLLRFVEESLRGEPQTPVKFGLRLYQWIAILSIVIGGYVTTIAGVPAAPVFSFHLSSVAIGLACGIAGWFLSGVDFPESNRRFARLT